MRVLVLVLCIGFGLSSCRDTNGENPPTQEALQTKASEILSPPVKSTEKSQKSAAGMDSLITDTVSSQD